MHCHNIQLKIKIKSHMIEKIQYNLILFILKGKNVPVIITRLACNMLAKNRIIFLL